jgi:hypothetical protein
MAATKMNRRALTSKLKQSLATKRDTYLVRSDAIRLVRMVNKMVSYAGAKRDCLGPVQLAWMVNKIAS